MAKMILTNGYYAAEKGSWNWITDGSSKFNGNKNISLWFADLPNLTDGEQMFYGCTNLSSFEGDLSALTNGEDMFWSCSNLTSFRGDLSSLTNGSGMFGGEGPILLGGAATRLDLASVQNIANTINDLTAAGTTGTLDIGIQGAIKDNADLATALEAIRAKGWTVNDQYVGPAGGGGGLFPF